MVLLVGYKSAPERGLRHSPESTLGFHSPQRSAKVSGMQRSSATRNIGTPAPRGSPRDSPTSRTNRGRGARGMKRRLGCGESARGTDAEDEDVFNWMNNRVLRLLFLGGGLHFFLRKKLDQISKFA